MAIELAAYHIAYMALPKAACSSVKAALALNDPDIRLEDYPESDFASAVDRWHKIYPTRRFRPHRWEKYDTGWWRFAVVRDPAKRLMSCYTNRVVELKDLHNSRKLLRGDVDLPMDPDPDFFFQNLDAYRAASSAIKHHALPAWLFLGPLPLAYDRVYKVEEMDQLAQDLSDRIGHPVTLPRENPSHYTLALSDLKPKTQDALRGFLADEYAYLDGYYDNPMT